MSADAPLHERSRRRLVALDAMSATLASGRRRAAAGRHKPAAIDVPPVPLARRLARGAFA